MTTAMAERGGRARSEEKKQSIRRALIDGLADQQRVLDEATATLEDLDDDHDVDADSRLHAKASRQRAAHAISRIDGALARLYGGTYGTCEACGDTIASARLEALPETMHCIRCASVARMV
jgi:DnaK suppressor protein